MAKKIINGVVYTVGDQIALVCETTKDLPANVKIRAEIDGVPVISIEPRAFLGCQSLISVTIPDSVTNIGYAAFSCCDSLKSVTMPNSVTAIHDNMFSFCKSLTSIKIPDSVKYINEWAFYGCHSLKNITIPQSVTCIDESSFEQCISLTSITIPNNVKSIKKYAFNSCESLKSVTIPNSVTSIGDLAFCDCLALKNIVMGENVISIGNGAFSNTAYYNNKSNWEDNVLYINNYLIEANDAVGEAYSIKENTKVVADSAFYDCSALKSITIPDSVTNIGFHAFHIANPVSVLDIKFKGTSAQFQKSFARFAPRHIQDVFSLRWDGFSIPITIECSDKTITI